MDEQRAGPLAASALLAINPERVPEEVQDTLRERVQLGELRAGILVAELLEIVGGFEARGIDVVAHKGPALALLAYGRVGARDPADLDLVVHEGDVTAAEQVLRERGYRRHSPGDLRPRLEAAWRRAWNETEFVSADGWVFVDLHWRVCPERFPFRVDSPRLWSRLTRARLDGREVPVFRAEAQVVLLSVHGAKDRWERLIWLCDLDRLVRASPALDWSDVFEFADEGRCRRAVGLALLLAHRLLGTPLPADVQSRLTSHPSLVRLSERLEDELAVAGVRQQRGLRMIGVSPFQLEIFDAWSDGVPYVVRSLVTPMAWDWELLRIRLPDSLYALYYPLRLARLGATAIRDSVRSLLGRETR